MAENVISDKDQEIVDFLADVLSGEESHCALVLGPDFFSGEADDLAKYIKKDSSNIFYLPGDGLMYFKKDIQPREEKTQYKEIINFLKSKKQSDVYAGIARLPFSLIISLSPDDFLLDAYNAINKPYYFYYYKDEFKIPDKYKDSYAAIDQLNLTKKGSEKNLITDKQKPLALNLLGHYGDLESLVYTHHALFEYLYSLPVTKIPETIRLRIIEKIDSFLILGVHFNKWYLKLIFFLLSKLTKGNADQTAIFSYNDKDSAEIDFYKTYFKIEFLKIDEKNFIKALIDKTKPEALFKATETDGAQEIKQCFLKADYTKCLQLAIAKYGDEDGTFATLTTRFNDNEKQRLDRLLSEDDYSVEKNKIIALMKTEIPGL